MELALFFYLANVADSVSGFLFVTGACVLACMIFIFGITGLNICIEYSRDDKWGKYLSALKKTKFIAIGALCMMFVSLFLPSQKTMYTMAAAYGAQSVAENPDVKRLAGKSLDVLEQAMDKYLDKGDKKAP